MIDIRPPADHGDIRQIEAVQQAAWNMSAQDITPYNTLHAWIHAGGIVLGAFDGAHMVGFCASFPGKAGGKRVQWSHMTGVIPDYRRRGIGRRLKLAQRTAVLDAGFDFIAWTYDPMRKKNAVFNIEVLGARSWMLHPEFYGEMSDEINRGLLSDRFEVLWDLNATRVQDLAAEERQPFDDTAAPSDFLLTIDGEEPQLSMPNEFSAPEYAIQLPSNLDGLRARSPELTHRWYYALREAVSPLFDADYTVDRVLLPSDESFVYVLKGAAPWFLYIVETADGSLYTGITTDVGRRIKEHNAGRGARYTKSRRPVTLLAAWRTFGQGKALKLEHQLKAQTRAQKLGLVTTQSDFRGAKRIE